MKLHYDITDPKITKTCQTGYTNQDRHKLKIEPDVID